MQQTQQTDSVEKVRKWLHEAGFPVEIRMTEATIFTVEDASMAVGVPPSEILKSILLLADERPVLALMSGPNKVDLKKVKRHLNARKVRMCDPDFVFAYSGFRIGGVPPVGYPEQPFALLDEELFQFPVVWAAAGSDHAFFPISPEELRRITGGEARDIKK
ncbi:YbaK/EbsC family protein [Aminiphilus circumscriptus]|uniref:YbaK/EbsC family protein n=1 Tax=Aminiphilus circumscriptus TaxID=290732 RepID=UPI000492B82B|nr:YbaK/EbsC family protein [Aminiphilus circumscriptus]